MASRYRLCSFVTCPWVQRAAIVLQAKGIAYDIEYIDRDNRPDWFLAISPHAKVPVLLIDGSDALFESNAIAEYLDEAGGVQLHPREPLLRARNRAWTDFLPTFASAITAAAYANDEKTFIEKAESIAPRFKLIEDALSKRASEGPFFNGKEFSLVDAGYAPFLQRYTFMDRLRPVGVIEQFPNLDRWRNALLDHPPVQRSTVPEIEVAWRENLVRQKRWLASFLDRAAAAQ